MNTYTRVSQPKNVDTIYTRRANANAWDLLPYRKHAPKYTQVLPAQTGRAKHKGGYDYHKKANILTGMYQARGNGNQARARYVLYEGDAVLSHKLAQRLKHNGVRYKVLENTFIVRNANAENGYIIYQIVETTQRNAQRLAERELNAE